MPSNFLVAISDHQNRYKATFERPLIERTFLFIQCALNNT